MTIRYNNAYTAEALLLSRTETCLRVLLRGADDVTEVQQLNGRWITDDCEPVEIDFGEALPSGAVAVNDHICTPAEASLLLELFFSGELDPKAVQDFAWQCATTPGHTRVM